MRLTTAAFQAMPDPKPASNWSKPGSTWPWFLNNTLGCCTATAKALITLHFSRVAQAEIIWPDDSVLKLYEATGGYVPGNPATDNGAVLADVNDYMITHGQDIGLQAKETWSRSPSLDHKNAKLIAQAIDTFGAVDLGWQLTQAMATSTNGRWQNVAGSQPVGGHDAIAVDQENDGTNYWFKIVTWTQEFWCDLDCFMLQCDEARLPVNLQHWQTIHNISPSGFSYDQLLNFAKQMSV